MTYIIVCIFLFCK